MAASSSPPPAEPAGPRPAPALGAAAAPTLVLAAAPGPSSSALARLKALGLPSWAGEMISQYESGAASQFICYGNVNDRLLLPLGERRELGSLSDFLARVLLPRFDVVLSYDLGTGLSIERGGDTFAHWPRLKGVELPSLPRGPREAIEVLTQYIRYAANLARLAQGRLQVACLVRGADLIAPAGPGGSWDTSALACQMRDWASIGTRADHGLATFLIAENLNDLHPLVATNPRAVPIKIPLPQAADITQALGLLAASAPTALGDFASDLRRLGSGLAGATLASIESTLKERQYLGQAVGEPDVLAIKKALVEKDCSGLIEFIASTRTLDDLHGQDALKQWLRQDLALWRSGDLAALPMGYLLCGPVGTGKTFMVECLAGEAGVPVVKLKNFRDKWVGSTEGNLEKIFRLIHALGRAYVFIDEADQALGRRDAGSNDGGIGGRIYGMIAEEMSRTGNRGSIVWILASSRPDLIEVDLKRPGRIDVTLPIFPTTTVAESWALLETLIARRGLTLTAADQVAVSERLPLLLTPGAAEAVAVKTLRLVRTSTLSPGQALASCLVGYQNPLPAAVMEFQIGLAVDEATDIAFVPPSLRRLGHRQLPTG